MSNSKHYVIVGGGVAAVYAAKAIRDLDAAADITILGEETRLPYNRIKLTKGLFTDLHSDKVLIKKEKWYNDNRITVKSSAHIVQLHTDRKLVDTAEGDQIAYDKLLLCMGATNRALPVPGAGLKQVHSLRELKDADRLKAELREGDRIAVIGGGVQGLETAWALHEVGYRVTVIEAAPRLMARQLDEASSERLRKALASAGVEVVLQRGITAITGEETVQGIMLSDETTFACEHVVYSIGIVPNTKLVQNTAIEMRSGIVVNSCMETSEPDVYAAGDVAEIDGLVEGLWGAAMEQGHIAGHNMAAAEPEAYRRAAPVTLFNAFGVSLFSMGTIDEAQCDLTISGEENGIYTRLFVKDNTIIGAISWEGAAASLTYKAAIEQGVSLDGIDLQNSRVADVMAEVEARLQN